MSQYKETLKGRGWATSRGFLPTAEGEMSTILVDSQDRIGAIQAESTTKVRALAGNSLMLGEVRRFVRYCHGGKTFETASRSKHA